jgi:hypothetical protein
MVEKLNRAVDSRVAIGPNFVDHSGFPGYLLPHRTAGRPTVEGYFLNTVLVVTGAFY